MNRMLLPLLDFGRPVVGLSPITPSSSTPDYVSMKGYTRLTAIIIFNNATTVTGSAITLKQATAVAGTSEKALSFSKQWANSDISASDALTETDVTSDTFTLDDTDNKDGIHVIEIKDTDLDMDNDFDCVRVGTANATAQVVAVLYILHGAKYDPHDVSAITD